MAGGWMLDAEQAGALALRIQVLPRFGLLVLVLNLAPQTRLPGDMGCGGCHWVSVLARAHLFAAWHSLAHYYRQVLRYLT